MPEVPSGTATFLFTDVEGPTRLLKGLREGYREVLAEHQRILREAFAADDGIWVANSFGGTVTRVDPQTNEVVETITLGHLPSWVAVGGGRIWVSVQP